MSKKVKRLFEQFQPQSYQLTIAVDSQRKRFGGTVIIAGSKTGRPAKRLTFHQNGLRVTATSVTRHDKKGDTDCKISRINHHASLQEVRLHSEQLLYPGHYSVSMSFEAPLSDGMTGIYPCYFSLDGQEKQLIATQFESHHAREAFPCIDEPEAKATFQLSVVLPGQDTVLANTPADSSDTVAASDNPLGEDGWQRTTFAPTPRMSSYLLAFVAGDMITKSARTSHGTQVALWATAAQPADALDFGLETAVACIEFYEQYFGVPYPLPKADHVALPDFSSGAMENWGLITYRERVLLAYPDQASQSTHEQIAAVIAHETSHQWFGNLVTMRWWDDLWLNESFANLMEYRALDALHPEWHAWDSFVAQEGLSALWRDATPGVQAVRTGVNHPDEINTLFDPSIVYAKGGRLLYMLMGYISEAAFCRGLTAYFEQHAYGNTEGRDLWAALSQASGQDVSAFMTPWLERPGFPVVTVSQSGRRISLSQSHFSNNPAKADRSRLWPVPLFASDPAMPPLLQNARLELTLSDDKLLLLNQAARGHYIVRYELPEQRRQLAEAVRSGSLNNSERLMVLNDASMLARAGYQRYGEVLDLLLAYGSEHSQPVWDIMAAVVSESRRFVDLDQAIEPRLQRFVRQLIAGEYRRLGWHEKPSESTDDHKLRGLIIGLGGYAEEPDVLNHAAALFKAYQKDNRAIAAELRAVVLGLAVREGLEGAFELLLQQHDATSNSDLKADLTAALTMTRDDAQARQLLGRLQDSKLVKPQDADRWLAYLLRNRHVRRLAWKWMVDQWPWLEKTYSHDKSYDYLPRYAASACNTPEWARRYRNFFEPKLDQLVLRRNILIGLEEIDNRVAWLKRDLASVQAALPPGQ